MKRLECAPLLALLLAGATMMACHSGSGPDGGADPADPAVATVRDADGLRPALDSALRRWQSASAAAGNTYFYWRLRSAGETGVREITGIQVVRGRATRRYITRARVNHAGAGETRIFERVRENVGAGRPNPAGFPARTMETLFENCRRLLPKNAADAAARRIDFELGTDARGVLRACWIAGRDCHGDCATNLGAVGLVFRELSPGEVDDFMNTPNPRPLARN